MKVLVIGDMTLGRNARSVAEGYRLAGHDMRWIDTSHSVHARKGSATWVAKRRYANVGRRESARFDQQLVEVTGSFRPDLVVAIKTIFYDQEKLLELPGLKVHLSFDDVSNPDNITDAYLRTESAWDMIVTTKRHNVPELIARGARDVLYVWGAFDPSSRRIVTPLQQRRYTVGFIGAARPDRRNLPKQLGAIAPNNSVVWGPRWRRYHPFGAAGVSLRGTVLWDEYTAAANDIKVGLVFLNSDNRDLHTNRSIETPATGQAVLAQRTTEHLELFDEGEEALFFDSIEEMQDRARLLVADDQLLTRIAEAGHRRITSGGFTYTDRAQEVVRRVGSA